jgi:hypothetical protein
VLLLVFPVLLYPDFQCFDLVYCYYTTPPTGPSIRAEVFEMIFAYQ